MKIKKKNKKQENKFGVYNGNIIDSETLAIDSEFEIEEYEGDSLTIAEIKSQTKKDKKPEIPNIVKPKKKINFFLYKLTVYIIILLLIISLFIFLVV
ncbi:hypothetical protein [Spiroplasma taiwanense]|uniref:Transmembrane protein n=1 Tax=Spiroplasma taiwanense CT-1 TaxID=1276220 RepID=S5LUR9_9MOLU|nr:hypothetical protein [Spiroplasma taiwanense]AGR41549.1 hypothetical protein STAIW_v1c09630 [Spiroplasma taiwanense CT-1]